ncbi:MAG TPA: hypothetical protein VNM16_08320 [Bacillota bacterium]|nr:hypothetical protein [Bacillota bacterium]
MFVHAGGEVVVRMSDLVAIIDRRTVDDPGPTRELLEFMRSQGRVEDVAPGEVKSVILCSPRRRRRRSQKPGRIVLSPISVGTLHHRVGVLDDLGDGAAGG